MITASEAKKVAQTAMSKNDQEAFDRVCSLIQSEAAKGYFYTTIVFKDILQYGEFCGGFINVELIIARIKCLGYKVELHNADRPLYSYHVISWE